MMNPLPFKQNESAAEAFIKLNDSAKWQRVRASLKAELGETTFRSWLQPLMLNEEGAQQIVLSVPTRFMREWVHSHYLDDLLRLWKAEIPSIDAVSVIVDRSHLEYSQSVTDKNVEIDNLAAQGKAKQAPAALPDISSPIDPRLSFDNFVTGRSNELAFAAAQRVARAEAAAYGCNPLYIYGGVGRGKTHLLHAIAASMREEYPQKQVVYLSAEKFMYQFVQALRDKQAMRFKERFRAVDTLIIDDVQFIAGKETTQEEFFHTFNSLIDNSKQLVISSDRPPSEIEGLDDRIRSRLSWGLAADIGHSSYELRLGILQSKLGQMQDVLLPSKVLEFMAHKITSNIRELEGALNRIIAHSTLVGRAITLDMAKEVLSDLLRANDRRITIEDIQRQVAKYYNIKLSDMHSARRSRAIARPRQVAMYLSKKLTSRSLPEIGRKFGGRDHTTIMHAVKRIDALMAEDVNIADDLMLLRQQLQG